MAIPIHGALQRAFPTATFRCYDKVVPTGEVEKAFGVPACSSIVEAVAGASLVVIANNHPEFESLPMAELGATMARPGLVYDYWNHFDSRDTPMPEGVRYAALGDGSLADFPARRGVAAA
jgi:hypothetical protein